MDLELKNAIDGLGTAFEEFKKTNDERLAKLAKGESVADVEQKLSKIENALERVEELKNRLDDVETKGNRIVGQPSKEEAEYKEGFAKFMRKGDAGGIESKAVNTGNDADGGFAVPEELDRNIIQILRKSNPMRSVCNVITVGTPDYKKLANLGGAGSGWVGETDPRPETGTPKLAPVAAFMGEIYANPAATQTSLDDAFFDVEAWLASEVTIVFDEKENAAYTAGNGENKPKGFLAYANAGTPDGTRPFGTVGFVASGIDGSFNGDSLIDLIYATKQGYRQNGRFMLSNLVLREARKLKDNEGNYLWQPGLQEGEPSKLLGYGAIENEDMPELAADSLSLAFGDWKRFYTVVDRIGTRVLRDPYTNKPYVQFYTTKRVGGFVENSEAVKLLKLSA
ncbi:phage major capsid protein [Stenotrophomonas bentonitica]|uniref:phage major capsid protein n=1 Tax=Stenotrophomonas bentonitica TaxID=1450134 RepID=UPI003BA8E4C1